MLVHLYSCPDPDVLEARLRENVGALREGSKARTFETDMQIPCKALGFRNPKPLNPNPWSRNPKAEAPSTKVTCCALGQPKPEPCLKPKPQTIA